MIIIDSTPEIKVNTAKLKQKLQPYLIKAMEAATDELLKAMQIKVHTVTGVGKIGKGGPGDPEWRNELDHDLKKLYLEVSNDMIESAVGADWGYGEGSYSRVRAMLIAYGGGSRSTAPGWRPRKIHAGPPGRIVWDDDLSDQLVSESKRHAMPDSFNQAGNMFHERAIEEVEQVFSKIAEQAFATMPDNLLADCFYQ